jgi:hypothetical protein
MTRYWNRNLISSSERLPTSSATSGIYDLVSQKVYKQANLWPSLFQSELGYSYFNTDGSNPTTQSAFEAFFSGTPAGTGVHSTTISWKNDNSIGTKPSYLPDDSFAWQVEGYIYIATAGTYFFGTGSDDGNQLTVDGTIVTSYYGGRGVSGSATSPADTGSISLSAGYITFRYRMQEGTGGDGCYVSWKPPGESAYALIPANFFFRLP